MAKVTTSYVCSACGNITTKWAGKCESCGEWNSISEQASRAPAGLGQKAAKKRHFKKAELVSLAGAESNPPRMSSGAEELDRVLGGGLVHSSALLVGGDPGIGKSTLLLQAAAAFARKGNKTIYVSGEEAASQIRMRAARLGLAEAPVQLAAETNLRDIMAMLEDEKPDVVIIDSIQTMWADNVDSAPGSVGQVRAASHELVNFAKTTNTAVILVGHVTKEGQLAGPRVVEHMVDTVLYFEGERSHQFRILRAVKNRFGPAHEIGVFEMTGGGLKEVLNPSAMFLSDREKDASGSVVFAGLEGTRPVLVEFQALVAPSSLGNPRRAVVGWDSGRLSMILAVLEARWGVSLAQHDVYLNVGGGLRVNEPAADLAAAAALLSAAKDFPIPHDAVIFGEISLSGAIRPVPQAEARIKEAKKLGFNAAWLPSQMKIEKESGINVRRFADLGTLVRDILGDEQ